MDILKGFEVRPFAAADVPDEPKCLKISWRNMVGRLIGYTW